MWPAEMGWDLMKSDKNKCDWYEIGSYQIYLDNLWLDETKWDQMGLDETGSGQRGSDDKRIDQMISDEHRWHIRSDKIWWDQILDYMIGSY